MTDRVSLRAALAARLARISKAAGYNLDLGKPLTAFEGRTTFVAGQDALPAVSVNYIKSSSVPYGTSPRYSDTVSNYVILGAVKRGKDGDTTAEDKLLGDIERAVFARFPGDEIDRCENIESDGDLVDPTTDGEGVVYVLYSVNIRWCNDATAQDDF